ncbi:EamA family transporter [Robertmurraya yapensis]|uniref:EamA family transporter n=2 Tax=Bacillaceae TaxID=186817 RepID=A0A3S0JTT1_9BACI|nr:EamA family transporter [Bacillus yapensis]RTR28796.1 EamA family transporter [Bacillus yapensis]TKS94654.1 EamA family transporter [Bacillus yapensis]
MKEKLPPFFILLAAILWGTTGTTQAFAPETAHPIAIGATRLAVGGLFLLLIVLVIGKFNFQNWPIKSTIMASLCMALYQPLFFSAVSITGVAIGTVIAIGSAPIFSGLTEWIYLKIRPSKIWWYSTFLSIVGCLMLFVKKESVLVDPVGIVMAIGAGFSFACYTLISRSLLEKHSSLSVVAVVFTLSAICLSPLLFIFDMSWIMSFRGVGVSLQLGIMATGIAYLLFAKGLIDVSSSTAVTLSLAEPLTAALLGVFLLGEYLTVTSWLGMFLLLLGIGLLISGTKKSTSIKGTLNYSVVSDTKNKRY